MRDEPEGTTGDTGATGTPPGGSGAAGSGSAEAAGGAGPGSAGGGGEDEKGRHRGFSEGLRQGLGVLSAFKDALEETIKEARDRGDLSSDRTKEAIQGAMSRARQAAGEARERLDFATQAEVDEVRARVEELKVRLENLERRVSQDPDVGPVRESKPTDS